MPVRLLVILLSTVAVALVGCGSGGGSGAEVDGAAPAADPVQEQPEQVAHIHGLGLNPADRRLYIATHHGLFALGAGENPEPASRVGDRRYDLMGFAVVGPDHFLASGHPAPGDPLPANLGLIESRDGGRSWRNVSLLGEADFHALGVSGEHVYGFDSQAGLLASADGGRSWERRATPAPVFSLAVDPDDASAVVIASEGGLHRSEDGGASWEPLNDEVAGLLAWPAQERLHLLDPRGTAGLSTDGGRTWESVGELGGAPVALHAHEEVLYAALDDASVRVSHDGGRTWSGR